MAKQQQSVGKKFLDKMFWLFTPGAVLCFSVALYQSYYFLSWDEAEAQVGNTSLTCMAVKKYWWEKIGRSLYYPCDNWTKRDVLRSQGYDRQGSTTFNIDVTFNTADGKSVHTTISHFGQDITDRDKVGPTLVKYSPVHPEDADFSDYLTMMIRVFSIMGTLAAALSVLIRIAQKRAVVSDG